MRSDHTPSGKVKAVSPQWVSAGTTLQAGDGGQHVVRTQEGDQMFGGRTLGEYRGVAAIAKRVGAITP